MITEEFEEFWRDFKFTYDVDGVYFYGQYHPLKLTLHVNDLNLFLDKLEPDEDTTIEDIYVMLDEHEIPFYFFGLEIEKVELQ